MHIPRLSDYDWDGIEGWKGYLDAIILAILYSLIDQDLYYSY